MTLQQEQMAFDRQVARLLLAHAGQFALCKEGVPVVFFRDFGAAYAEGLERHGRDAVFLVAEVAMPVPFASVSWEVGAMKTKRGAASNLTTAATNWHAANQGG